MDGFQYRHDSTDQDSARRMALVRAGFVVWSLTWHDLEVAFGRSAQAADFLDEGAADGHRPAGPTLRAIAEVHRRLDEHWDTAEVRERLRESSMELLLRYLADPAPEKWQRSVFTALPGRFEQPRMLTGEMRSRFDEATTLALPGRVREALEELGRGELGDSPESRMAVGGGGVWLDTPPPFADLFLALPVQTIANREPDDMAAAMHLHDDETSREDPSYRPVWNGVLRLFNLLQFLPNAWWTTRVGVRRTVYPELARAGAPPPSDVPPEGWDEAIGLAAPELWPVMEHWYGLGLPVPEAGFELADAGGRVIAEAEVAWPERKVAVLLPDQQPWATFEEAGWMVVDGAAENLAEAIAAILVG